ncbi:hypothetical protein L3X38_028439 [Prunus dulcis]|uniref:Late embryogenesis abundant protein LEA-2 subgroup domain-containing protein n=1 Tax=Prunus dulcis TaxID=3755 RepID=A0AAD4VSH5_PRUDU|nr:hypothetical protein L3X38_028439 [Prunus dulcis]
MAEKTNQTYPSGSANTGYTRSDGESQLSSHELKRKKRIKLAIYIAIFVVFQTIVITIMSLTVLKVKTPKFRLGNISVQSFEATSLKFNTQIKIKNSANWGSYKFKASNVTFQHQGNIVGVLDIEKGKVGWLSTIKRDVNVNLSLNSSAISGSNLGSEVMLNSVGRLEGKVAIMFIMKKKKATNMNCTIAFAVKEQSVSSVHCK